MITNKEIIKKSTVCGVGNVLRVDIPEDDNSIIASCNQVGKQKYQFYWSINRNHVCGTKAEINKLIDSLISGLESIKV